MDRELMVTPAELQRTAGSFSAGDGRERGQNPVLPQRNRGGKSLYGWESGGIPVGGGG